MLGQPDGETNDNRKCNQQPPCSAVVYYGVQKGWNRGVYDTWKECKAQIVGVRFAKFRKFSTHEEAKRFAFPELYPLQQILDEEPATTTHNAGVNHVCDSEILSSCVAKKKACTWIKHDRQAAQELEQNTLLMKRYLLVGPLSDQPILPVDVVDRNMSHVWIAVDKRCGGKYCCLFDPPSPDGRATHIVGIYPYTDTPTVTRLKLTACTNAVQHVHDAQSALSSGPRTLIVHTDNEYLNKCLTRWSAYWFSNDKRAQWAREAEQNHRQLEDLTVACAQTQTKLLPVTTDRHVPRPRQMMITAELLLQDPLSTTTIQAHCQPPLHLNNSDLTLL